MLARRLNAFHDSLGSSRTPFWNRIFFTKSDFLLLDKKPLEVEAHSPEDDELHGQQQQQCREQKVWHRILERQ